MKAELNAIQNEIRCAAARKLELDSEMLMEQHRLGRLLAEMKSRVDENEWRQFVSNDCKMDPNEAMQMIGGISQRTLETCLAS